MRYLDPKNDMTFKKVFGQHPHLLENPEVREAIEILQESAFTEQELETYDKYWDQVRTERTLIGDSFEKGIEKGEQIGLEKGMKLTLQTIRLYQEGNTAETISGQLNQPLSVIRQILSEGGMLD